MLSLYQIIAFNSSKSQGWLLYFIFLFIDLIDSIILAMSFLEKFKGKTTILKKDQVTDILGEKTLSSKAKHNPQNQLHLLKLTQITQNPSKLKKGQTDLFKVKNPNLKFENTKNWGLKSKNKKSEEQLQPKKIIENPFLVQNQFFLDEKEHEAVIKRRKEEQIRERIQKQRKKRQQMKEQMMKSLRKSPQKNQQFSKKQWIKLGGLGANIGGEQWTKKKNLQQKMFKFAEQIKKINQQKSEVSSISFSLKLRKAKPLQAKDSQQQIDSRSLGIKYSKLIQKPTFYSVQKMRSESNQIRTHNSDFQVQQSNYSVKKTTKQEPNMLDPEENQFKDLKMGVNSSEIQILESRHKEFESLIYSMKN